MLLNSRSSVGAPASTPSFDSHFEWLDVHAKKKETKRNERKEEEEKHFTKFFLCERKNFQLKRGWIFENCMRVFLFSSLLFCSLLSMLDRRTKKSAVSLERRNIWKLKTQHWSGQTSYNKRLCCMLLTIAKKRFFLNSQGKKYQNCSMLLIFSELARKKNAQRRNEKESILSWVYFFLSWSQSSNQPTLLSPRKVFLYSNI